MPHDARCTHGLRTARQASAHEGGTWLLGAGQHNNPNAEALATRDSGHGLILVARWCGMDVTGPDASAVYPLGSSPGESARLQRQAEELAADSAALLDRVGLRPGQAAIDLGCGPRGTLDLPSCTGDDLPAATLSILRQAPHCATGADERLPGLGPRRLLDLFEN